MGKYRTRGNFEISFVAEDFVEARDLHQDLISRLADTAHEIAIGDESTMSASLSSVPEYQALTLDSATQAPRGLDA